MKFTEEELVRSQKEVGDPMAESVRLEMVHCWRGYREKAWGHDEVRPVTGGHHDWVAIGITILDTIDTIWLMGLKKEYEQARDFVAKELEYDKRRGGHQSVFEVTIRALGGLVSAYSLTQDEVFLKSAKDLGDRLMRAFATESGLPKPQIDLVGGSSKWSNWSPNTNIAEVATLQMEFRQLGSYLHDEKYWTTPDKAFMIVVDASNAINKGLVPIHIGSKHQEGSRQFNSNKISLGAMGDSYYEYLIKQWLQGGKKDENYITLWIKAMNEMVDRLVVKTAQGTWFV